MKFNLKECRTRAGLTQSQLADKLNVSRSAIARWENGFGYPELENFKMLSIVLGVPMDALLTLDDADEANYGAYKRHIDKKLLAFLVISIVVFALSFVGAFSTYLIYSALVRNGVYLGLMVLCIAVALIALLAVCFFSFARLKSVRAMLRSISIVISFGLFMGFGFFVIGSLAHLSDAGITPVLAVYMAISIAFLIVGILLVFLPRKAKDAKGIKD